MGSNFKITLKIMPASALRIVSDKKEILNYKKTSEINKTQKNDVTEPKARLLK